MKYKSVTQAAAPAYTGPMLVSAREMTSLDFDQHSAEQYLVIPVQNSSAPSA